MTASVPWTMLNFNHTLENLRTKDDYNFTNFLSDREMACPTEGSSYCCFQITTFRKYFLITFISIYCNLFQHFIHLLED